MIILIRDFAAECALADSSMMTRKDSGLNALWNVGFQRLQASGEFQQLCEDAQAQHGMISYSSNICLTAQIMFNASTPFTLSAIKTYIINLIEQ